MTPTPKKPLAAKGPSKAFLEMQAAVRGLTNEGELHRQAVTAKDQKGGYQAPPVAVAPPQEPVVHPKAQEVLNTAPSVPAQQSQHSPSPTANGEAPPNVFDLPQKRRTGKVSDPNYRSTSVRIHKLLWDWARVTKANAGWDLADLINIALADLKREYEMEGQRVKTVLPQREAEEFEALARKEGLNADEFLLRLCRRAIKAE